MSAAPDLTPVWGDRGRAASTGRGAEYVVGPGLPGRVDARPWATLDVIALWPVLLSRYAADSRVGFSLRSASGEKHISIDVMADTPFSAWRRTVASTATSAKQTEADAQPIGSAVTTRTSAAAALGAPPFEIVVGADAGGTEAGLVVRYDDGRFDEWTIEQIARHLTTALDAVSADSELPLARIPFVDVDMRETLLHRWNDTRVGYRDEASVSRLFEEQADRTPAATAVVSDDGTLTYRELEERANRFAAHLRARGVRRGDTVALCLERSIDTIVALVGILKAGGTYVPLEPAYPRERLAFMLRDTGARVLITQESLAERMPVVADLIVIERDSAAIHRHSPERVEGGLAGDDRAYIMYTSGSTGVPKGVQIAHRSINRLVCAVTYVDLGPAAAVLHAAPLAFDASTFEIWGALLTGGRCVLYPERIPTPEGLGATIRRHGVTTSFVTTALFNAVIDEGVSAFRGLRQLLFGGELVSARHVRQAFDALPELELIHVYGPTETTTFALGYAIPRPVAADAVSIPIGRPIRDTTAYVLNAAFQLVPVGCPGELYIGGSGVATGYLNRSELTAERFLPDPFADDGYVYRTGDIVQWNRDGQIEFIGRADDQVKISGYRIELGEIAAALSAHTGVKRAAVTTRVVGGAQEKKIVAYLLAADAGAPPTPAALRDFLRATLPEYMVPTYFMFVDVIPLTGNGKVDFRALPDPVAAVRPDDDSYVAPATPRERTIAQLMADVVGLPRLSVTANVFELGASSLGIVRVCARLRAEHGLSIPVIRFFEHPTVRAIAAGIDGAGAPQRVIRPAMRTGVRSTNDPVAIVGMAVRMPGAPDVRTFWKNLLGEVDSVSHFGAAELDRALPESLRNSPAYVPARGIVDGVEMFDARFFGMTPREAQLMDPQQRIFLEIAWEALEDAGYVPEQTDVPIGIFGGVYNNSYASTVLSRRPDLVEQYGAFNTMLLNEKDFVATRAAHKLGLTGPALSLYTACSTSLVAVCQAVQSLRDGQCGIALAGGVSLTIPTRSGYLYQEGGMLASDGRTRSFDASASGTVFSDGAGMVVLKRLSDAQRDADTVYAVISGVAVNNDGAYKASFTAPSVEGQATVIASAQADAGVSARDISYVEAHGTATPLGDPIEVEALVRAFQLSTGDRAFCALGSVKSNIGHTVIAAGVAGLIKTALSLREEVIPASLYYTAANPGIDFAASPFFVNDSARPWPRGPAPRRAGVSSFGVGGTNAHVVVEEAPADVARDVGLPEQLLVLSARSPAALDSASVALAGALRRQPAAALADVAYTLQLGRKAFPFRRAVACASRDEALALLESPDARERSESQRPAPASRPEVAFMFPGQGAQYVRMGATLYGHAPVFREEMDRMFAAAHDAMDHDLRSILFHPADEAQAARALKETSVTQPALYAVEYSLARLWESWGVTPGAMIGHSVGEFVAAALAGVFSPEEGMRLVATRGRLMQSMPPGSMLSVRLPASSVSPRLTAGLAIASDNAPELCVVAGPTAAVEALRLELVRDEVACSLLHTSHAFHSSMMDPAVDRFAGVLAGVALRAPSRRFISSVSGAWITDDQATDPMYWARHLRETVRFADGVKTLGAEVPLLLEVGPRATLASLARAGLRDKAVSIASLHDAPALELRTMMTAMGALWRRGADVDWLALHAGGRRRRIALPKYQFERQRHWVDGGAAPADVATPAFIAEATARDEVVPVDSPRVTPSSDFEPSRAMPAAIASAVPRRDRLVREVGQIFAQVAGIDVGPADVDTTFVELGFDSLTLTQVALALSKSQGLKITFRQLLEDHSSVGRLADFIDAALPPDAAAEVPPAPSAAAAAAAARSAPEPVRAATSYSPEILTPMSAPNAPIGASQSFMQSVIDQQLRLMAQQLAVLGGGPSAAPPIAPAPVAGAIPTAPVPVAAAPTNGGSSPAHGTNGGASSSNAGPVATARPTSTIPASANDADRTETLSTGPKREFYDAKKAFGAAPRITRHAADEFTPKQQGRLDAFIRRYTARTKESKRLTQENRPFMADPRVATGFRPAVKELVYPVVVKRSAGSRMWDVDGNEFIDVLSGFGSNMFGWSAPFVVEAVKAQIDEGFEIGPQHILAAEVTRLFREVTGTDRVAFCNTGSEAVLGAIRIARTVTGRNLVVIFAGSYHGINDEVIVRGNKKGKAFPAAPGILASTAENILVLEYGTPESLQTIRERASELAAVIVEPVQSRRPDFQPREFLRDLRGVTEQAGIVYIWDEIVTGFRAAPGGAQEYFGVQADLATYGKVVGGGLSIGVIAGKREFMDALDGGQWQYGDASVPEVGVTYFAGTFVRHPLALASARAVLTYVKERGPALQRELTERTTRLATTLNQWFVSTGTPIEIRHFASIWKTFFTSDVPNADLLFYMLRDRGIHIYEGFPCFLTTATSEADVDQIIEAFKASVNELRDGTFLPEVEKPKSALDAKTPPVAGARLGRDRDGNPAWFIADPNTPGKYLPVTAT